MSVCFTAGGVVKTLQIIAFTLVWTHSVEKTDWQEDWQVSRDGLTLVEARVKGSGAGVDPPPGARLNDGWWRWHPAQRSLSEVVLSHSGAAGDWRICAAGRCRPLSDVLDVPAGTDTITLSSCAAAR